MKINLFFRGLLFGTIVLSFTIVPCEARLSQSDSELLSFIAQANRANRNLLESFDCDYSYEITKPQKGETFITETARRLISKKGRFAFSSDKVYSMDKILGKDVYLHHVRNGSLRRTRSHKNVVLLGSTPECGLKPGTPDPWEVVDENICLKLDNIDGEKLKEIVSVEQCMLNGHDNIKVAILGSGPALPDGSLNTFILTFWYSIEQGCMPVKYKIEHDQTDIRGEGEVQEIREFQVNGNTLYLPIGFREEVYTNKKLSRIHQYNVDTNSIQINPELPDELFQIEIRPDDQVINMDLGGLELQGPGGRKFLMDLSAMESNASMLNSIKQTVKSLNLDDKIVLEFVCVPKGEFIMGSPDAEIGYPTSWLERFHKKGKPMRPENEGPCHKVTISQGFCMSKYEITCAQFRCFRPSYSKFPYEGRQMDSDNQPVLVSWDDAIAFCKWVSKKTGIEVRLPTEAEWEYACRAGSSSRFFWGDKEKDAGQYANVADKAYAKVWPDRAYCFNTDDKNPFLCPVGQYKPNNFGLYDMIGNALEWCKDVYVEKLHYPNSQLNRKANQSSTKRVIKGGSWRGDVTWNRCAFRGYGEAKNPNSTVGFRVIIEEN